jgi:RNA polymerase sigma factor (sigma-70 family)
MNVAIRDLQTLFEVGSLGGLSDGQLLGRFLERREGAVFEVIVDRHGPMVWGVCRRVLRDHHDAEDAFQATFLVLARKASSVLPRERLGNWLYGVAFQTAMNARAMRAKRRARETQVPDMPEPMVEPDDLRDALAESLDRELSRLPEKYRIPLVLCELEGQTHREAAEQLGWPIGTVSSRLSRAKAMLASRLSRRGLALSVGSLAVMLAQESASAGMPTKLIGSTAKAASLFAARAGVVSAEVAALTREVMKMMLLGKLKIGVVLLLVASAVAAGGTALAFQAQKTEPSQKDDLQRLIDEKNAELQRLIEKLKGEGQHTDAGTRSDSERSIPEAGTRLQREPVIVGRESGPFIVGNKSGPFIVGNKSGPFIVGKESGPEGEPLIDLTSGLEGIAEYSPDQLRRQKEYIDAMLDIEAALKMTPEGIERMIAQKTEQLDNLRRSMRLVQAQITKLKKLRDAGRSDKNPRASNGPSDDSRRP